MACQEQPGGLAELLYGGVMLVLTCSTWPLLNHSKTDCVLYVRTLLKDWRPAQDFSC